MMSGTGRRSHSESLLTKGFTSRLFLRPVKTNLRLARVVKVALLSNDRLSINLHVSGRVDKSRAKLRVDPCIFHHDFSAVFAAVFDGLATVAPRARLGLFGRRTTLRSTAMYRDAGLMKQTGPSAFRPLGVADFDGSIVRFDCNDEVRIPLLAIGQSANRNSSKIIGVYASPSWTQ